MSVPEKPNAKVRVTVIVIYGMTYAGIIFLLIVVGILDVRVTRWEAILYGFLLAIWVHIAGLALRRVTQLRKELAYWRNAAHQVLSSQGEEITVIGANGKGIVVYRNDVVPFEDNTGETETED